jgi:hypothetical protein
MSATAKFYTGFAIVLVLIVSAAYLTGYRAGWSARAHRVIPVHRATASPSPRPTG